MGGKCSPEHRTVSPDDNYCANFWGEVCVLKSCVQVQGDMMSIVHPITCTVARLIMIWGMWPLLCISLYSYTLAIHFDGP